MEVTSAISFLHERYSIVVNFRRELQPLADAHQEQKFVDEHDVRRHFQLLTRLEYLPWDINVFRKDASRLVPH